MGQSCSTPSAKTTNSTVYQGITNYNALIAAISSVLKKGGYAQLQEWDFFAVDAEKQLIGTDRWFGRWCAALRHALANRNANIGAADSLEKMLKNALSRLSTSATCGCRLARVPR